MAGKPLIGFNSDTREAAALAGFMAQLSLEMGTTRHIGPVLKYTHSLMVDEFINYMTVIAGAEPSRFHHVYEWGQVGDPSARLWQDVLVGGGNSRVATFTWRASKQTVPVRDDFKAAGVKQIHVFVWKAPVMEYSTGLTITPKRGNVLAYFTGPTNPDNKYKMQFTKNPIRVKNPGGPMTRGAFTREYVKWWGGDAGSNVFNSKIKKVLEEDLGRMPIESATAPFRRIRSKNFTIQTPADYDSAMKAGAAAAKKYLAERDNKYIEAAKARERLVYGQ